MKSSANILRNAGKSGTAAASSQLCSSLRRSSSVLGFEFEVLSAFADPNARIPKQAARPNATSQFFINNSFEIDLDKAYSRVDTDASYRVPDFLGATPWWAWAPQAQFSCRNLKKGRNTEGDYGIQERRCILGKIWPRQNFQAQPQQKNCPVADGQLYRAERFFL
jgi:hypothetical protein